MKNKLSLLMIAVSVIVTIQIRSAQSELGSQLLQAAKQGDNATVVQLLTAGVDVNYVNDRGNTALIQAVHRGHEVIVKLLIHADADIDQQNSLGKSALFIACESNNSSMFKLLLEHGAASLSEEDKRLLYHLNRAYLFPESILLQKFEVDTERRIALKSWCDHIDKVYDVPPVLQRLIVRDLLGTVPAQMSS